MTKLNIGPGDHPTPEDWTAVDLEQRNGRVDVIGSLLDLPFPDNSAEQIYCGHVLEHIQLHQIPRACQEIIRVLTTVGVLMVVGPDINKAVMLGEPHELLESIVEDPPQEYHDSHGALHAWTASETVTANVLAWNGFTVIPLPVAAVESDNWPIGDRKAPWQFALKCYVL